MNYVAIGKWLLKNWKLLALAGVLAVSHLSCYYRGKGVEQAKRDKEIAQLVEDQQKLQLERAELEGRLAASTERRLEERAVERTSTAEKVKQYVEQNPDTCVISDADAEFLRSLR